MLRFYRVFGERMWLILWWMKERGYNFGSIGNAITGNNGQEGALTHWKNANIGLGYDSMLAEMKDDLEEQLKASGEHQDGALLNLVINALNNPHSRNILGGETLASLRRALLLPEELASATERINNAEMHCGRCAHLFSEREVASFSRSGRMWLCVRCAPPMHVACSSPGCSSGVVRIPTRLQSWLGKSLKCEQCAAPQATSAAPIGDITEVHHAETGPTPPPVARTLNDYMYSSRRVPGPSPLPSAQNYASGWEAARINSTPTQAPRATPRVFSGAVEQAAYER